MTSHGNPTLLLPGGAQAGQVIEVAERGGRIVWRSHPLAAGRAAVCVDVRDGRFRGPGRGWSVLPPGRYEAPGAGGAVEVTPQCSIDARFDAEPADWMPPGTAWHRDGAWRAHGGGVPGIAPAGATGDDGREHAGEARGGQTAGIAPARGAAASHGRTDDPAAAGGTGSAGSADRLGACSYLFVDAAMHATVTARFTAPRTPAPARWGLIARHYNDAHHVRVELCHRPGYLAVRLLRRAADADPEYEPCTLAQARSAPLPGGAQELHWHFNGTRHEVRLDGEVLFTAADGFMAGVEVVGMFAEAGAATAVWHSFGVVSSQWVARHEVRRGCYAAVLRPGNIHQLHLSADPARLPARLDPDSNVFWESGLQVGHIGGSEVKFTQGAALDLLAGGAVADLVRWRGPMPRMVDQDADVRGWARGHAVCYDTRLVVADWAAVRVRRSVGPDFDLLRRAMTGPARFAAADTRTFTAWELPADGLMSTLASGSCARLYPAALAFPVRAAGAAWHLVAAVGSLSHAGGDAQGRVFGWRCPRGLTASHDLRVAPTEPGVEYGFWIALSWLASTDAGTAEAAALGLRDQFQSPARLAAQQGELLEADAIREQPADRVALAGCFDRGLGAYRLRADGGRVRFTFEPGTISRHEPAFLVSGLGERVSAGGPTAPARVPVATAWDAAGSGELSAAANAASGAGVKVSCAVDGVQLAANHDYRWQPWPAPRGVLVQLRRTVAAPLTVELSVRPG